MSPPLHALVPHSTQLMLTMPAFHPNIAKPGPGFLPKSLQPLQGLFDELKVQVILALNDF